VDTKDTKDSFYARPVEAVPLVDDPRAVELMVSVGAAM
jgi:hypothetical protein